jgi:hypothetical protein
MARQKPRQEEGLGLPPIPDDAAERRRWLERLEEWIARLEHPMQPRPAAVPDVVTRAYARARQREFERLARATQEHRCRESGARKAADEQRKRRAFKARTYALALVEAGQLDLDSHDVRTLMDALLWRPHERDAFDLPPRARPAEA